MTKMVMMTFSYGKLVTYRNDGTSLRSVRQIRRTEFILKLLNPTTFITNKRSNLNKYAKIA